MSSNVKNINRNNIYNGNYVGGDNIITNIIMLQDTEREFVVTHNANIMPVIYFTGREIELRFLRKRIEEKRKSVLVSGMGGIGKTHICRKLFEEYLSKYANGKNGPFQHIGYIEYNGDMDSSLQNCLKYKQQENPEQNQEAAWKELEYLASGGKLLLFVDNVDKTIKDDPGLQKLTSIPGAVILTSRQASFGDLFEPYRIGFLGMEQCKEIYEKIRFAGSDKKIESEEVKDLEYVIETLAGKHTITTELLAHLARTRHWTIKDLRDQLGKKGFRLKFHKDGELINIQESYEKLYDLSKLTKAEQNILEAFSVFPYIPLSVETCNQWLLADAHANEEDDILDGLYQKGWLQFEVEQETYTLHPVFAQFIYDKNKPKTENHLGLMVSCQNYLEIPQNDSVQKCQSYIPFAESIVKKFEMGESTVQLMMALAFILQYIAEYKKAEELYEKSLRIWEQLPDEELLNTISCYNNLAGVYTRQGRYGKAEALYKKILRILELLLDEEHLNTAVCYNNLAGVYTNQGRYEKAEILLEKSLRITEHLLGEDHPDTALCYNNLAWVYSKQGRYEKAEILLEKSLRIRERLFGEDNSDTATCYYSLADVYMKQGRYEEAEALLKKSHQIKKRWLGEEHLDTVICYSCLAIVYADQGRYEEAEKVYEKILPVMERLLGEEHPDTVTCYNNLAIAYTDQGRYEEAEKVYKKILPGIERLLIDDHPNMASFFNNLARIYVGLRKYEMAVSIFFKSYSIYLTHFGFNYPDTQVVYTNLKAAYSKWNPEGNFEQWLEEVLKNSSVPSDDGIERK